MTLAQIATRIAASLGALALVGAGVVVIFATAFSVANSDAPSPPPPPQLAADGQRPPDLVGRVESVWGDQMVVATPGGKRTVALDRQTVVRAGESDATRDDLRPGIDVAVFGAPLDIQTFRAALVVILPPR